MTASGSNDYHKLTYDQVVRLEEIVRMDYVVQPVGDLPKITVKPQDLIASLKTKLEESGFVLKDIRINGSAASVVIGGSKCQTYNDLDILFNFVPEQEPSLDSARDRARHNKMRLCVLKCLEDELSEEVGTANTNYERLAESYFQKYVLVQNSKNDLWSLVALRSAGRSIELKFVDGMKRKYEFSIDSFQLIISEYLTFRDTYRFDIFPRLYPTVFVESVYGDYNSALEHLEMQLIATRNPEEIRGGGLLKYCYLRTCGYRDADPESMAQLNKYMCSRFFIDFPDVVRQRSQLEKYLVNHFTGRDELKHPFLLQVRNQVHHHAFALPMRERTRTIDMIDVVSRLHVFASGMYGGGIYANVYSPRNSRPFYLVGGEHPDGTSTAMASHIYNGGSNSRSSHQFDPHCMALPVYITTITRAATIS